MLEGGRLYISQRGDGALGGVTVVDDTASRRSLLLRGRWQRRRYVRVTNRRRVELWVRVRRSQAVQLLVLAVLGPGGFQGLHLLIVVEDCAGAVLAKQGGYGDVFVARSISLFC